MDGPVKYWTFHNRQRTKNDRPTKNWQWQSLF